MSIIATKDTSWFVYCYMDRAGAPIYVGVASRNEEFEVPASHLLKQAMDEAGGELPFIVIREGGLTHGAAEMLLRGLILAIGCKPSGSLLNDPDAYPDTAFHAEQRAGKRIMRQKGSRREYSYR